MFTGDINLTVEIGWRVYGVTQLDGGSFLKCRTNIWYGADYVNIPLPLSLVFLALAAAFIASILVVFRRRRSA
jgi:hypothetical protein